MKSNMKTIFISLNVFFLLTYQLVTAQSKYTEHTLTADGSVKPCACKIEQLSWMVGNWLGNEDHVISEEQWSQPIVGTMMGMYRMVNNGKPIFYELMLLIQDSSGIKLQLKHFSHPLKGWENKDDAGVIFTLLKVEGRKAYFDGMTYDLTNSSELIVYLAEKMKDGGVTEEIFRMRANK